MPQLRSKLMFQKQGKVAVKYGFKQFIFLILMWQVSATAIPNIIQPTLEDFAKEPQLRDVALSPNGRYLAQVWNKHGYHMVTVQDLDAPGSPIIGKTGDNIVRARSVSWANNDRLLVGIVSPGTTNRIKNKAKEEDFDLDDYYMHSRIVAMDVDGKNSVVLMKGQRSWRKNVGLGSIGHYLPNDPSHVLINSFRRSKKALFKINVYTGKAEVLVHGSVNTFKFISDEKGIPKYRIDYVRRYNKVVVYEYVGDEDWNEINTVYLDEDDKESIESDAYMGLFNDELVYRKINEKTGYYDLVGLDQHNKVTRTIVSLKDQDVRGPVSEIRTNKIIGYSVEKDNVRLKFFDASWQEPYDNIASYLDGYNFKVSIYGKDSRRAIVHFWGPDNLGAFSLYDTKTQEIKLLDYSEPKLSIEKLSLPAVSTYKARDGQKIRNYILLPADYEKGMKYPLIVMPHGGPQSRDRSSYDNFAQFVSTRGYIVSQPNFRGSTGYGRDFEQAGYKQWGQLMQDDVTDAVKFMIDRGFADPEKICIVGYSYGGYAALMGAVKTPDLYQCAVSINGVTHLEKQVEFDINKFRFEDKKFTQKYILDRIGDPDTDEVMLDKYSPALHADKITIPVLIIAGEDDNIVPIEQAEIMLKALKKYKKDVEFIEVEDADHDVFDTTENTTLVYKKVAEFLATHIREEKKTKVD
jgi:dipeptidyl aminopeptidase/acylaminoacyl peptidase